MKAINSKGISTVAIVGIVVIVLLAGGLVWWQVGKDDKGNANANTTTNTNNTTNTTSNENLNQNTNTSVTVDPVTGWNIYTNDKYGYRLKFPKEWHLVQPDVEQNLPAGIGIWAASFSNYLSDNLEYHPEPGEISVDVYIYDTYEDDIQSWYKTFRDSIDRELYEKRDSEVTLINGVPAIIEKIITGKSPAIPVDTEWLNGKMTNIYIKNKQQVLEISAIVWTQDANLLETANQIAQSLAFTK